jgi:conjugal transfer/entry exclusion protein
VHDALDRAGVCRAEPGVGAGTASAVTRIQWLARAANREDEALDARREAHDALDRAGVSRYDARGKTPDLAARIERLERNASESLERAAARAKEAKALDHASWVDTRAALGAAQGEPTDAAAQRVAAALARALDDLTATLDTLEGATAAGVEACERAERAEAEAARRRRSLGYAHAALALAGILKQGDADGVLRAAGDV